jgi:S-methylmethionine-dependent homocysteine/selenocysteine methylase
VPRHRDSLPQLGNRVFLTDGGIETSLIHNDGIALAEFAAFVLLGDETGRDALRRYWQPYVDLARAAGAGFVLEAPTWRASPDWGARLGYTSADLSIANRAAVDLMVELREQFTPQDGPAVISACVGPRADGYLPAQRMSSDEACRYHAVQVGQLVGTEADLVTGMTITDSAEAIGLARAAVDAGLPVVVSFTVETDGALPSGEPLGDAVRAVDDATDGAPAYFMVNCAHPTHFAPAMLAGDASWVSRIRGVRANASTASHAELDAREDLDTGDAADLAQRYAELCGSFTALTVLGGCCGTDHRHLAAIRDACLP